MFGSWARREEGASSDLGLLIDFDRPIRYEIVALANEFERRLGLSVDIVFGGLVRRRFGQRVLDNVRPVSLILCQSLLTHLNNNGWRPKGLIE